jgi:dihydroorotate dehydrogenase/NAD-dependent dihydropyrimidine dehydrogenase PreA subunit
MLTTDFLGFSLKNPLMLTEGPLSGTGTLIQKAAESGVGLIFTKGIRPKAVRSPVPYMSIHNGSLMNADWSCIGMDEWVRTIKSLDIDVPLVTSIAKNYVTAEEAVDMAERLVKAGSKIVSFVDYDPLQLIKTVELARPRLKVPIMIKLPPFLPELEKRLKALAKAGVDAIAAMDSIGLGLSIDIETGIPSLGSADGSGYLSGKAILPFTLKYIYEISRAVNLPVVGVGGVSDAKSAIQMLMAGATGVGMATAPLIWGLKKFDEIRKGMVEYLEKRNCKNLGDIRGKTIDVLAARQVSNEYKAYIDPELCDNEGSCRRVCYSQAIAAGEKFHTVDRNACTGCGLCAGVCPTKAISYTLCASGVKG